jgi:hypothetical protein
MPTHLRLLPVAPLLLSLLAACDEERDCNDEIRIAASVFVSAPEGAVVDQVTIEKKFEDLCGSVSSDTEGTIYQCWEQAGGGTYVVRVYSGERVWSATQELDSASCHVAERAELFFDLSQDP